MSIQERDLKRKQIDTNVKHGVININQIKHKLVWSYN